MQRTMSVIAVAGLLVVGLAACGSDEPGGGSTAARTTTAADTTSSTSDAPAKTQSTTTKTRSTTSAASTAASTSTSSTTSPKPKTTTQVPQTSAPETSTTTDGQASTATLITNIWVDDSWTITEESSDVCASLWPSRSTYSRQDDIFTCGAMAYGALACTDEGGGETLCITDGLNRKAMRFSSPTVASEGIEPSSAAPQPLYVELEDGVKCPRISHDHEQHWGGKFSW